MAIQLEQLHNDRLRLENRNSVLEKVNVSYLVLPILHGSESSDCPTMQSRLQIFLGVVQVLEMKEIEEAKPAASSSGMQLNHPIQRKHSILEHNVAVLLVVVLPAVTVSQSLLFREDVRAEKPWESICMLHPRPSLSPVTPLATADSWC